MLEYGPSSYERRDGRVAEGGGLENRFTSDRDGGSNPSPSASFYLGTGPQIALILNELSKI
jgi:hypothetical protein